MADGEEITGQEVAAPEQTDEDFDWAQFFAGDEEPAPETAPAEPVFDPQGDDLRAQLAQAQADSKRALELATQAQTQGRMVAAVEAWKAQATPAEIELQALLLDSKSPEELQKNAQIVKVAAARLDATSAEREARVRREMEVKMQQEFGLPVPPTFQPMPEEEKVNQLLKEGNLADAAATMMKGFM